MTNSHDALKPRDVTAETHAKAMSWLSAVRKSLQSEADIAISAADYLSTLDLDTPSELRQVPHDEAESKASRFLTGIESQAWSGHMQAALADLEDRRTMFGQKHGVDISLEQLAALQTFLDHPDFS